MPPPYQRRRRVGCICAVAIFTRASDLHCSLSVTHTCTDAGSSTANSGATEDRSGYIDVIEVVEEEEVVVVEEEEEDWIVAEGTASESHIRTPWPLCSGSSTNHRRQLPRRSAAQ